MSILGESLKLYCAANNITQKTLAQTLGISEATVSRVLNEGRLPDAAALTRIQAWMVGESVPPPSGLESRVEALEEANKRQAPAIRAAWGNVPIGGQRPPGTYLRTGLYGEGTIPKTDPKG